MCGWETPTPFQKMVARKGAKTTVTSMDNNGTHWLKSWTLPQCTEFWEGTLKQNVHRSLSLFLDFHPHWEIFTGPAGAEPTRGLGLTQLEDSLKRQSPTPGCVPYLAPALGHWNPVQHMAQVLDCFHSLTPREA